MVPLRPSSSRSLKSPRRRRPRRGPACRSPRSTRSRDTSPESGGPGADLEPVRSRSAPDWQIGVHHHALVRAERHRPFAQAYWRRVLSVFNRRKARGLAHVRYGRRLLPAVTLRWTSMASSRRVRGPSSQDVDRAAFPRPSATAPRDAAWGRRVGAGSVARTSSQAAMPRCARPRSPRGPGRPRRAPPDRASVRSWLRSGPVDDGPSWRRAPVHGRFFCRARTRSMLAVHREPEPLAHQFGPAAQRRPSLPRRAQRLDHLGAELVRPARPGATGTRAGSPPAS